MIDIDLQLSVGDGLRHFDLQARFRTEAAFAALYGPSGAGKTLTLQAVAGLLKPDAGHIRIDGRTLFDSAAGVNLPARERRIGYLFQHYALFPHLSVRENVGFGLTSWSRRRLSAADQEQVQSLLDTFGLAAMADSRPRTLSGGQQQRVALARALASQPKLLLLDEPFAALNPMLKGSLRRELAEVRRRWDIPVLMITHDIEDVLELGDAAFVFHEGRVVQEIDLHSGVAHDLLVQELGGSPKVPESALRRRIRGLLEGTGEA
jgi:molybdate transport system ATP-binding protein